MTASRFNFRAWIPTRKEMVNLNGMAILLTERGMAIPPWDTAVTMQSTGLTDKNGREIYEGDIYKETYPAGHSFHEIKFGQYDMDEWGPENDSGVGFYASSMSYFRGDVPELSIRGLRKEFVGELVTHEYMGNIYENPELVK